MQYLSSWLLEVWTFGFECCLQMVINIPLAQLKVIRFCKLLWRLNLRWLRQEKAKIKHWVNLTSYYCSEDKNTLQRIIKTAQNTTCTTSSPPTVCRRCTMSWLIPPYPSSVWTFAFQKLMQVYQNMCQKVSTSQLLPYWTLDLKQGH